MLSGGEVTALRSWVGVAETWTEAGALIERGLEKTISQKKVTYDLARQMTGATELKTSEFADAIIGNM